MLAVYARRHPPAEAEAHAEAAREFIMAELVTKQDLALALDNLALRMTVRLGRCS
jgi:hypothetical protein